MSEPSRRKFFKGVGKVVVVGAVGAALGSVGTQALALPPNNPVAQINAWNQIEGPDMIVWVDSSGNYYVKDTGVGSSPGSLVYDGLGQISGTVGITAYGNSLGAGTTGALTATGGIQEAISSMAAGGTVYMKAGIYNVSTPILIPWGLTFTFIGDGLPSFRRYTASTYATPSDGTQIRATNAFLTLGGQPGIFTGVSGAFSQGNLYFYHMAVMLPYGLTTTTHMTCVVDSQASPGFGRVHHVYDDIMFVPWGWTEAGMPISTNNGTRDYNSLYLNLGGSGTSIIMGAVKSLGMVEGNTVLYCDYVIINQLFYNHVNNGWQINTSAGFNINELSAFDMSKAYVFPISVFASVSRIGKVFVEGPSNPAFIIDVTNHYSFLCQVDEVYVWNALSPSQDVTAIIYSSTKAASVDNAQLLGRTYLWTGDPTQNGSGTIIEFPHLQGLAATSFGGTIANSLLAAGPSIGTGGNTNTLVSGTVYKANLIIDVTVAAGTTQTVTVKDDFGNVVDNALATLTHRLMFPNWTITVTAVATGALTVVQGTIGNLQALVGTTATAQVNVKYYVLKRMFITDTIATGTLTTYDGNGTLGTSNEGLGNIIDSVLPVPVTHYSLEGGQVIVFGTAAPVIGTSGQIAQL